MWPDSATTLVRAMTAVQTKLAGVKLTIIPEPVSSSKSSTSTEGLKVCSQFQVWLWFVEESTLKFGLRGSAQVCLPWPSDRRGLWHLERPAWWAKVILVFRRTHSWPETGKERPFSEATVDLTFERPRPFCPKKIILRDILITSP